jgi:diaminohydroxyphosphoribosylaminopyrimidine deaminase/5-amino-6-(5-phosphoribosylamino)uracil reductase
MGQALGLAEQAIGLSEPNPRVGCVITTPEGRVIGQGHTQQAGGLHAEIMALRDAQAHGESVRGATAYVTLEPCAHHGRTPPCCDALIHAGLQRVVVAITDPNPLVAGQGNARMRDAGLVVDELPAGRWADAAREINIGFFSRMQRQRPWVRLKAALSLDGRTALPNGQSQWITGPAARTDGHAWRKRAGAILTGIGTVLADNPRLDVRQVPTAIQPVRVIVDSRLQTPPDADLFSATSKVLLYATQSSHEKIAALTARGAEVITLPRTSESDHLDLGTLLENLGQRGINELHIEAGEKLNGALIRGGWVDEYLIYMAPVLMGYGRDLSDLGPFNHLQEATRLHFRDMTQIGDDLRLIARPMT